MRMTTVLIEDYALLRIAIQHVLEHGRGAGEVRALASAELEAVASSVDRPPELAILGCSGVSEHDQLMLTRVIATLAPRNMLLLYPELDLAVLTAAARAGVAGYVAKSLSPDALGAAISLVMAGGQCYPLPVQASATPVRGAMQLTQRQEQILRLMVQGKTMREISREVGTSVATVKSHARTLYWKLNARNQAAAAYAAVSLGLVPGLREDKDTGPADPPA
ncbi:DNA-binding response regulator [Bordetella bronchiseptica]|nr:DNA-binding response regulator [Bordetella bronchiseptica]KDC47323.1 sigma-70, region 4 [Bordetella bronchiseptica M85/00/2]KDC69106.1 sigma-70, region 4 [Bordetella bronchiseptica MBORD624]QBS68663.1 helix-turn-helix transcriptional regulator [Bordetella bronchiseptica]